MSRKLSLILISNTIVYASFGILALLPLMGISHITWTQLINFVLVTVGLLFLFFKYRTDVTPDRMGRSGDPSLISFSTELVWFRLLVFLYFVFLLFLFYPTGQSYYNAILYATMVVMSVFSVFSFLLSWLAQKGEQPVFKPLSGLDKAVVGVIIFIWLVTILSRSIQAEDLNFSWLKTTGIAIFFCIFYLLVSVNLSAFVPGSLKFPNLLPYWILVVAVVANVLGIIPAIDAFMLRYRAQVSFSQGNIEKSAKLYLDFERQNKLNIPLKRKDIYPKLGRELMSKDAVKYADQATFFTDISLDLMDEDVSDLPMKNMLFQAYLDLGKAYSVSGRYEKAFDTYHKMFVLVDNPIEILKEIQELPPEIKRKVWEGDPYIVQQDFESDKTLKFRPVVQSDGWSHTVIANYLSKEISRSGKQSLALDLEYKLDSDPSVVAQGRKLRGYLWDYWYLNTVYVIPKPSIRTGIKAFVRGEKNARQIRVCLVVNFLTKTSSSVVWSSIITLSEDWSEIVAGLDHLEELVSVNGIGISIFEPVDIQDIERVKIYMDDIQFFTYSN
jgi:tetratricopeptide (TPR) repeat protein